MSVLHMRTDEVRGAAGDLDYAVNELYLKPTKLRGMANSIVNSWESAKAQYYAGELRRLASLLQKEVINLQRLAKDARVEVAEWEEADHFGGEGMSISRQPIPYPPPMPPAPTNDGDSQNPSEEDDKVDLTYEVFSGKEGHIDPSKSEDVVGAKLSLEGQAIKGNGRGDFNVGGADIGGTKGDVKVGAYEYGIKGGVDDGGKFSFGAFGEVKAAEATGVAVLGSSLFGLTASAGVSAGSAEGFVGIKDNSVGASIGASAVAGEVGLGLNIAGINVGLDAGISAGLEFGIRIGKKTTVKVGPFKIGLSFGAAKTDAL